MISKHPITRNTHPPVAFFYGLNLSLKGVFQKVILFLLPRSLTNTYRRIQFLRKSQTYSWSFTKTEVPFIGISYLCLQVQIYSFRMFLTNSAIFEKKIMHIL